jgi:hypothetical protein
MGMTRLYEDENKHEYSLTKKRTEYKVTHLVPVDLPGLELMFVVFENSVANFYDVGRGMKQVHQLEYEREFEVDVQKYIARKRELSRGRSANKKEIHVAGVQCASVAGSPQKPHEQSQDPLLAGDSFIINDGFLSQVSTFEQIKEEPENTEGEERRGEATGEQSGGTTGLTFGNPKSLETLFKQPNKMATTE